MKILFTNNLKYINCPYCEASLSVDCDPYNSEDVYYDGESPTGYKFFINCTRCGTKIDMDSKISLMIKDILRSKKTNEVLPNKTC